MFFLSFLIPIIHWVKQSGQKSNIDEIGELVDVIKEDIPSSTKLSYTSKEKGNFNIMLYNYALLTMAPIVITDENFNNDTIVAIDIVEKLSKDMYPGYRIIKRRRNENFIVHLMVKK